MKRHWRSRFALLIAGGALLAACGTGASHLASSSHHSSTPNSSSSPGASTAPTSPPTTPATSTTTTTVPPTTTTTLPPGVGATLSGTDGSGDTIAVTLNQIADPFTDTSDFPTSPDPGTRFVALEFTITNQGPSGNYEGDVNSAAIVVGSNSDSYDPDTSVDVALEDSSYPVFQDGAYTIVPGTSQTGWVGFELPTGVTVSQVHFAGNSLVWQVG